eukprot:1123721-Heterocapsa_arctica.AAC.1
MSACLSTTRRTCASERTLSIPSLWGRTRTSYSSSRSFGTTCCYASGGIFNGTSRSSTREYEQIDGGFRVRHPQKYWESILESYDMLTCEGKNIAGSRDVISEANMVNENDTPLNAE